MNREIIMRCGSDAFGQSEVGRLPTTSSKSEVTDMCQRGVAPLLGLPSAFFIRQVSMSIS
jgi:hypothetical protein